MMQANMARVELERKGVVDRLQELGQQQRGLGAHSVQQLREQLTEATQQLRFKEQEVQLSPCMYLCKVYEHVQHGHLHRLHIIQLEKNPGFTGIRL